MSEIIFNSELLGRLARRNNFEAAPGRFVFIGLRGMLPLDISGTPLSSSHKVRPTDVNHLYLRCTIGQLDTTQETVALFPGSTVPHLKYVRSALAKGGIGANMLMLGH